MNDMTTKDMVDMIESPRHTVVTEQVEQEPTAAEEADMKSFNAAGYGAEHNRQFCVECRTDVELAADAAEWQERCLLFARAMISADKIVGDLQTGAEKNSKRVSESAAWNFHRGRLNGLRDARQFAFESNTNFDLVMAHTLVDADTPPRKS